MGRRIRGRSGEPFSRRTQEVNATRSDKESFHDTDHQSTARTTARPWRRRRRHRPFSRCETVGSDRCRDLASERTRRRWRHAVRSLRSRLRLPRTWQRQSGRACIRKRAAWPRHRARPAFPGALSDLRPCRSRPHFAATSPRPSDCCGRQQTPYQSPIPSFRPTRRNSSADRRKNRPAASAFGLRGGDNPAGGAISPRNRLPTSAVKAIPCPAPSWRTVTTPMRSKLPDRKPRPPRS